MSAHPVVIDAQDRMKKTLSVLKEDLGSLRTGRASTGLLEHLPIEVYGARMPLNQLATLNIPEPRMIAIQVWDKGTVAIVEKAIRESNLGLNPLKDGNLLRVPLPELTEDRRKDLLKVVHKYCEQAKVAIRSIRREGMDQLKKQEKNKEIAKDDLALLEKEVQEVTDKHVDEVDKMMHAKESDIMQI